MPDVIITISAANAQTFLDACHAAADTHMTLEARGHDPNPADEFDGRCDKSPSWEDQAGGESDLVFGKRCLLTLGKMLVQMVGQEGKDDEYRDDVAAVVHEKYVVPVDILT